MLGHPFRCPRNYITLFISQLQICVKKSVKVRKKLQNQLFHFFLYICTPQNNETIFNYFVENKDYNNFIKYNIFRIL